MEVVKSLDRPRHEEIRQTEEEIYVAKIWVDSESVESAVIFKMLTTLLFATEPVVLQATHFCSACYFICSLLEEAKQNDTCTHARRAKRSRVKAFLWLENLLHSQRSGFSSCVRCSVEIDRQV